jgi:hypothetical protein
MKTELLAEAKRYWSLYNWERGELLSEDKDEREEHYTMTTEICGLPVIGTGTYSCGELILIDDIEIKK